MVQLVVEKRNGETSLVELEPGGNVMQAMVDQGISEISALCGGACACATCHIYIAEQDVGRLLPAGSVELDLLDALMYRKNTSRLACQIVVQHGSNPMHVVVAPEE
jgi:ferredoxin